MPENQFDRASASLPNLPGRDGYHRTGTCEPASYRPKGRPIVCSMPTRDVCFRAMVSLLPSHLMMDSGPHKTSMHEDIDATVSILGWSNVEHGPVSSQETMETHHRDV